MLFGQALPAAAAGGDAVSAGGSGPGLPVSTARDWHVACQFVEEVRVCALTFVRSYVRTYVRTYTHTQTHTHTHTQQELRITYVGFLLAPRLV
jgi:invasion protein IalB